MKCLSIFCLCIQMHIISASIFGAQFTNVGDIVNQILDITNLNQVLDMTNNLDPEVNMNTVEIIQHWGFQAEAYNVTTKDGYIIEIHRIKQKKKSNKIPILLQHAVLCSSIDWVINLRNQSLGFLLADANYDVWLGNVRGNTYGLRHTRLTTNDKEFWEFSWDEMAAYDNPAIIDHILNTTGHKQLHYIGHSMGTTIGFSMLSAKKEYNKKIKTMFALAPVVFMAHFSQELLNIAAPYYKEVQFVLESLGVYSILSNTPFIKLMAVTVCHFPVTSYLCIEAINTIVGNNLPELNTTRLPVYITHTPAGTSMQTIYHYAQNRNLKIWQHYDWGSSTNALKYGSVDPPLYNLTNVKVPVMIFYSLNDFYADPEDVQYLADNLPNLIKSYQIEDKNWNHLDFSWGINAQQCVYKTILDYLKQNET